MTTPITPQILTAHLEGRGVLPECCIAGPVRLAVYECGLMAIDAEQRRIWTGSNVNRTCQVYNDEFRRAMQPAVPPSSIIPTPLTTEALDWFIQTGRSIMCDGPLTLTIERNGILSVDDDFDFIYYGYDPTAAMKAWNERVTHYQAAATPKADTDYRVVAAEVTQPCSTCGADNVHEHCQCVAELDWRLSDHTQVRREAAELTYRRSGPAHILECATASDSVPDGGADLNQVASALLEAN